MYDIGFKDDTEVLGISHVTKTIGNLKDVVCLQLDGQVSGQPKRCHSAMLDPKGRAFCFVSGSLLIIAFLTKNALQSLESDCV